MNSIRRRASCALIVSAAFVGASALVLPSTQAAEQKKSAPAPAAPAHPATSTPQAHPGGAPGAVGAHGPMGSASRGPTTGGAGHAVTTSSANHGVTTGGATAAHGITTSGAHPAPPGGYRPGGGASGVTHATAPSSFGGHAAPAGSHDLHAANGAAIRTRSDGSRSDVHDPARGMDIHHGLNGDRHVSVERADHTRIVAERGGRGYVQHPYMFHGHEFGHRTYFEHGRAYDRFYGRYGWHGRFYDVYAPVAFYPYGFYGYVYAPWAVPISYAWAPAPWYGPYGFYYAYYPVYPAPAFWLADFVFAASLAAAYEAGQQAAAQGASLVPESLRPLPWIAFADDAAKLLVAPAEAAANSSSALSPELKNEVSDEIKLLVQQEGNEAQANAAKQDTDSGSNSVMKLLGDGRAHVFVAGSSLDLVSVSGSECAISEGDVLRVGAPPPADADNVAASVLASKGARECAANTNVTIALSDLQDMHNHMRESVDDGLGELQKKQGTNGIPAAPAAAAAAPTPAAFAQNAPPPDASAGAQIAQQAKEADSAEQEVARNVASAPAEGAPATAAAASGASVSISVGQSIDAVTAALGAPLRIVDLGAKKIYSYKDMKVIFMNGRVSDVQ